MLNVAICQFCCFSLINSVAVSVSPLAPCLLDTAPDHPQQGTNNSSSSSEFTPSGNLTPPPSSSGSDAKWLSQVEILTHAPPSRRLWMGPQFTFKPYQSHSPTSSTGLSNSGYSAELIKTPSPPNTIIYSSSMNCSLSSNLLAGSGRTGEQSALLFPGVESPLSDSPSPFLEMQGSKGEGLEGTGGGQATVESGEIPSRRKFSWGKNSFGFIKK